MSRVTTPAEVRFWRHVDDTGTCWVWTASIRPDGYGEFRAGRLVKAHRFAYEHLIGPVPDGLHLDHLCRNRACVNPEHLDPVPNAVNIRRAWDHKHAQRPPRVAPAGVKHGVKSTYDTHGCRCDPCRDAAAAHNAATYARRKAARAVS